MSDPTALAKEMIERLLGDAQAYERATFYARDAETIELDAATAKTLRDASTLLQALLEDNERLREDKQQNAMWLEGYAARDGVVEACRNRAETAEARIAVLEAALRPFADMADQVDEWKDSDADFEGTFNADDLRAARNALETGK